MHSLVLGDNLGQALYLIIDENLHITGTAPSYLDVDCISGWEGVYYFQAPGVYLKCTFPPYVQARSLYIMNPRYVLTLNPPIYIPGTGLYKPSTPPTAIASPNTPPPLPPPTSGYKPPSYNRPTIQVGIDEAASAPDIVPAGNMCRCDIKQLMSTGHSPGCVDYPNSRPGVT